MLEKKTKNILENLKQKLEEAQKRNLVCNHSFPLPKKLEVKAK